MTAPRRSIRVVPIYGWGWSHAYEPPGPVDLEQPTILSASPVEISGMAAELGHILDGYRIKLTQRHQHWDGYCNLMAERVGTRPDDTDEATDTIYGFAEIPLSAIGA